jgi:hypothetical protein
MEYTAVRELVVGPTAKLTSGNASWSITYFAGYDQHSMLASLVQRENMQKIVSLSRTGLPSYIIPSLTPYGLEVGDHFSLEKGALG